MTSNEIRQQFLDFFRQRGHAIVPSSPVVPLDDPTLLFTNAGMNQFKDVFLGSGTRSYTRAADTQKCIRAGGKHNDLDDVGRDTYHHTFFEMLGNWSFGDYFKKEAIAWAWELLTQVWGIDKTRLHATYFGGDAAQGLAPDHEARDLWLSVTDIAAGRVHPGNLKDNFWEMGDTGPCGPCSEIHIDLTPDKSGGGLVNAGDHRVMEIWNLVFIQFNRAADGKLTPLPARHVDTGMGFERICAVLAGKGSNYDTDVFAPIFAAIQQRTGAPDYKGTLPDAQHSALSTQHSIDVSYRVIADHLRCLTFALTDGAVPSNEGRGYVLRRILRRAVRYGRQYFNMHEPFLHELVKPLVAHLGDVFPELRAAHGGANLQHVAGLIREEEESFGRTLDRGIRLFDEAAAQATAHHHGEIRGDAAFKLHDTYGFPIDLTELMAQERGLRVDIGEYERLMEEARDRARSGGQGAQDDCGKVAAWLAQEKRSLSPTSDSDKYTKQALSGATVLTILWPVPDAEWSSQVCEELDSLSDANRRVCVVLDKTCFYAEQGGQVGDRGSLSTNASRFRVEETLRNGDFVLHFGRVESGTLRAGDVATIEVDPARGNTAKNHTATHLLNWALREVLGEAVQQKGSLVDPDKARFDFSHSKPLTADELSRVEILVNQQIDAKLPVSTKDDTDLEAARGVKTLRAIFGEKYGDKVRVVSVGADIDELLRTPDDPRWRNYAVELCGGTHLRNSGEAERFAIISEEAVAKGVRRVVGVTGAAARAAEATGARLLERVAQLDGAPPDGLADALTAFQREVTEATIPARVAHALRDHVAALQQKLKGQQKQQAAASGDAVMERVEELLAAAETIGGVAVVVGEVPAARPDAYRGAIDWIRNKTPASAVLLASVAEGKVALMAGMSKDVVPRGLKAGDLIKEIAPLVGGKGGGRPDLAQGGGDQVDNLNAALDAARQWIKAKLG
jgi:alanyl-tRNA synthetase